MRFSSEEEELTKKFLNCLLTWKERDITKTIVHIDDFKTFLGASENPPTNKKGRSKLQQHEAVVSTLTA